MFSYCFLLLVASFALAACQPSDTPVIEEPAGEKVKVCQITDTGGIDDKSFNATAWKGIEDAQSDWGRR